MQLHIRVVVNARAGGKHVQTQLVTFDVPDGDYIARLDVLDPTDVVDVGDGTRDKRLLTSVPFNLVDDLCALHRGHDDDADDYAEWPADDV